MRLDLAADVVDAEFEELGTAALCDTSECRIVLVDDDDRPVDLGRSRPIGRITLLKVRVSEVTPVKESVFVVNGQSYQVISEPKRPDGHRLVWHCQVQVS